MADFTVRDREIIIACYALRVFRPFVIAVREDWRDEDIAILDNLIAKMEGRMREVYEEEDRRSAENTHRR